MLDDDYHSGTQRLVRDLNQAYRGAPALWALDYSPEGFGWIDANDADRSNLLSLPALRPAPDGRSGQRRGLVACIANFSGDPHSEYRVGLPARRAGGAR